MEQVAQRCRRSARGEKREGGHEGGPRNGGMESEKTGPHRPINQSKLQWGFPHLLRPSPLARPLWEVTRGCRQCSQGTIGCSRLQGLGGHTAEKDSLGLTGATPPSDLIASTPRSEAAHEKDGGGLEEGQAQCPERRREAQGPAGVCGPSGSSGY